MNLTYIIGLVVTIVVMLIGIVVGIDFSASPPISVNFGQLGNFFDAASIFIVIGCTFAVIVCNFPGSILKSIPKHFKILLNAKNFNPTEYIDQLVELAQTARKNGLLSLEEKAREQTDPFFKQAIMLIVDANDPDKVAAILNNEIECMSARHDSAIGMYSLAAGVAPAFGMVGTLVGLINMLNNMSMDGGGASSLGKDMGTAMITTLYGCVLAHAIFTPIATNLRTRDDQEILCKQIIVEGIMSIQSGENPKFLKEKLMTFMAQKMREEGDGGGGKKGK